MKLDRATLSISTQDIGLTQKATLWIGDVAVVSFMTGSRHEDRSIEIASELVGAVLRPLIEEKAGIVGIRIVPHDYWID